MLDKLMEAFEGYNERNENKLDWHTDVLDNIEDVENEEEIKKFINQLKA